MTTRTNPVTRVLVLLVRGYQRWISPVLGQHCRFAPSCSQYAVDALHLHGAVRGSWLAARRLLRCHPWNPGGHDPAPPSARMVTSTGPDRCVGSTAPDLRLRRVGAS